MSDDDETHFHATYASHWDMDDAFCARMWGRRCGHSKALVQGVRCDPHHIGRHGTCN